MSKMKSWKKFKEELLGDKNIAREYEKLKPRYQFISELIKKRSLKGLTQAELAEKIGTKQSAIARMESGRANPTIAFVEKVASALDSSLVIQLK